MIRRRALTRKRSLPAIPAPPAAITAYTTLLVQVSRALDAAIARELAALEVPVRLDAADGDARAYTAAQVSGVRGRLLGLVQRLLRGKGVLRVVGAVAARAVTTTRAQWAAQVRDLGIDLTDDEDTAATIRTFRRQNVSLIRSLLTDKVSRVHAILSEAGSGTRVETLQRRIEEETDATPARAALLARDQVLKLNAQVTADRHKAAGITEYIWRSSRDERVRKRHKALDGTRHAYDDPPVVDLTSGRRAHPGEDFRCRCTAEPVIPGVE